MKRFAALSLAVIMIFVFAVSAAALDSPTNKQYYKITVSNEGGGTVSSDTNKVEKNTDGTVTVTATNEDGYFTIWLIDGVYEIIDGSVYDEVITIMPHTDISIIGSFSVDEDYLTMTAKAEPEDLGEASVDIEKVRKGSDTEVTFTATETAGEFIEWEFHCDYKVVRGDNKSKTITIIPYTDVLGIARFKKAGAPEEPTTEPKHDDSKNSPKTADPLPYAIPLFAIAIGAVVISYKKLKKD